MGKENPFEPGRWWWWAGNQPHILTEDCETMRIEIERDTNCFSFQPTLFFSNYYMHVRGADCWRLSAHILLSRKMIVWMLSATGKMGKWPRVGMRWYGTMVWDGTQTTTWTHLKHIIRFWLCFGLSRGSYFYCHCRRTSEVSNFIMAKTQMCWYCGRVWMGLLDARCSVVLGVLVPGSRYFGQMSGPLCLCANMSVCDYLRLKPCLPADSRSPSWKSFTPTAIQSYSLKIRKESLIRFLSIHTVNWNILKTCFN